MDSDLIDALLAISAKFRGPISREGTSHFAWPRTASLVSSFVATCLSQCLRNASFQYVALLLGFGPKCVPSDDAWIALRKVPPALADRAHLAAQYTRVPLLVTLPLSHLPYQYEFIPPADDSSDSSTSESSGPSDPPSDWSAFFKRKWKVKIPAVRYIWMDLPVAPRSPRMQRNVFAADSPIACLCVFVVAERSSLCDAMSSSLYHRLSWGIHGPLVGVSFSPDSTTVSLHVGWLEDLPDDLVHILGSTNVLDDEHAAAGHPAESASFRLDDPGDAMALARIDKNAIPRWRADQEAAPARSTGTRWTHEAIYDWNEDVPLGSNPRILSFGTGAEENSFFHSLSFDQLSALRERNGYRPDATSLWLIDRYAVFHSLPPITVYHDSSTYDLLDAKFRPQVPFFLLYRTATKFVWPQPWQSLDRMPIVPHPLQGSERSLFRAFEASREQAPHCAAGSRLCDEAIACLEEELAAILRVSELARLLNAASGAQSFKFIYDLLFSTVHPWHAIQFARSHFTTLTNFADTILKDSDKVSDVIQIQNEHYWLQEAEARLFKGIDKDRLQTIRTRASSNDTHDWPRTPHDAFQRAVEAPTNGTCDLALFAPFHPIRHLGLPQIIDRHSRNITSRTYPTTYWPSPKSSIMMGLDERQRVLACDILATAHQDYPSPEPLSGLTATPNNYTTPVSELSPHTALQNLSLQEVNTGPTIDFPVLLVVHSVRRIRFDIADSNRLRICLTSAVQFLASMQVLDFPIFGLLTEGTVCAVVMAWATQRDGEEPQVHIMDQNCSSYDVSVPAGAFNLATFLLWLQHEHVPRLVARLDEVQRMGVFSRTDEECRAWSAQAQVDELAQKVQEQDENCDGESIDTSPSDEFEGVESREYYSIGASYP
ncbi:hypothetical protein AURDEDRAFT_185356 [Auricularia subglabra TFB-10046 SS5]|nr:hypothetical protein AURDEDRAFT_185356 [Auricularia subglabra TFB-10046 SS5]